jgi:hypothetical protein
MRVKIAVSVLFLFVTGSSTLFSQTFIQPNIALKSHETLEILKVETTSQKTVIYLDIENRISGGKFCADKNIFIIYPDGTRSKLTSSTGIPVCPDAYEFKAPGEKLNFSLTFPPLKQGTEWVDLVEDCTDNCFTFYGVTLNNELNKKIDEAFALSENGEVAKALVNLINIAKETDSKNNGIEGLLYISIIKFAQETGKDALAGDWYLRLKSSGAPRLELYIKHINYQGIKY